MKKKTVVILILLFIIGTILITVSFTFDEKDIIYSINTENGTFSLDISLSNTSLSFKKITSGDSYIEIKKHDGRIMRIDSDNEKITLTDSGFNLSGIIYKGLFNALKSKIENTLLYITVYISETDTLTDVSVCVNNSSVIFDRVGLSNISLIGENNVIEYTDCENFDISINANLENTNVFINGKQYLDKLPYSAENSHFLTLSMKKSEIYFNFSKK